MRNNNGRISGKAIALFLVVLSLVNIGILIVLRQNGTTTSKQERETTDAMELYEGESVATPEPTQEEEEPATSEGVTAEAPEIQEDLDGESPSENPEASAEPAESAEAAATPKPAVKTEQSKGGPSLIYQEDKVPTVTQDDLDRLAQIYVDSGALQALDANGNDISEDIKGHRGRCQQRTGQGRHVLQPEAHRTGDRSQQVQREAGSGIQIRPRQLCAARHR